MRAECFAVLLFVPTAALTQTASDLGSNHARYHSCMERVLGNAAYQKIRASSSLNEWGAPTAQSIEKLSPKVRESDATCRKESALAEPTKALPPVAQRPEIDHPVARPLPSERPELRPPERPVQPPPAQAPVTASAAAHIPVPVAPPKNDLPKGVPQPSVPATARTVDFDAAAERINQSFRGSAAVDAPSYVKAGKLFTVYLRVAPGKLGPLLEGLKATQGGTVAAGQEDIRLMPLMTATLSGLDFRIVPADSYERVVSPTETTTWAWQVEATKSGVSQLQFDLYGTLKVQGEEAKRDLFTYGAKVDVAVDWIGVLEENWQWLATTLLIPAAAASWTIFRRQRSPGALASTDKA